MVSRENPHYLFLLFFSLNGKHLFRYRYINIILFHAGKFSSYLDLFAGIQHIYARDKGSGSFLVGRKAETLKKVLHHPVHLLEI